MTGDAQDHGSGGAQDAAEAMPYHMHRRTDCNTDRYDPGRGCRAYRSPPARSLGAGAAPIGTDVTVATAGPTRWHPARVEYLVRTARITDIERLVALSHGMISSSDGAGALDSGSLLRQLVYLPQASIFVAEARREVVGGAVLALRPSVRAGGFVGTVDILVVDPDHDADRVTDALIEEVIRSARNKGCSVVEAALPEDPAERTRWERHGFNQSGPRTERQVAAVGAATRRSR
jgi:GNAT superfamily N-acetyltransferase